MNWPHFTTLKTLVMIKVTRILKSNNVAKAIIGLIKTLGIISMKWTDTLTIAESLYDTHPDIDPKTIRFTDLMQWVLDLDGFNDSPEKCGEKILEAIQLAWIEEAE
jgi:FeS assembly protein IscX